MVYIVCYDLSVPYNKQKNQLYSWLGYLYSLLPTNNTETWKVIVVGTRSDLQTETRTFKSSDKLKIAFPSLPLQDLIFHISTHEDVFSIWTLLTVIEEECTKIWDKTKAMVSSEFRHLLNIIKSLPATNHIIKKEEIISAYSNQRWQIEEIVTEGLSFLHGIGEIVWFRDYVCVNPMAISKIMAKFISPVEVRKDLQLKGSKANVSILSPQDIASVLGIETALISK